MLRDISEAGLHLGEGMIEYRSTGKIQNRRRIADRIAEAVVRQTKKGADKWLLTELQLRQWLRN